MTHGSDSGEQVNCVRWGLCASIVAITGNIARSEVIDSEIVENTGNEAAVIFSTNRVLSTTNSIYLTFDTVLLAGDEEAQLLRAQGGGLALSTQRSNIRPRS